MLIKDLVMWRHYNVILENSDITKRMWILKKKYDYWWKKYGLEKTDRATKTSLFDRNWAILLKPRRRSHPFDPYMIWCSIFYSKLVNCILFKIIVQHVRFVKGRGTCGSGERNVKIWIDFRKSPRFSLTSPLSQLREKSSRPVFTMCGEPW
jgi:hypothetical protein